MFSLVLLLSLELNTLVENWRMHHVKTIVMSLKFVFNALATSEQVKNLQLCLITTSIIPIRKLNSTSIRKERQHQRRMWRSSHRWNLESASKSLFLVRDMVLAGGGKRCEEEINSDLRKVSALKTEQVDMIMAILSWFSHPYMGGLCLIVRSVKYEIILIFFVTAFFLALIWHLSRSCLFSIQLCAKINSSSPFVLLADIFVSNQVSLNSRACRCEWIVYWHYHHVVYKAATLIYKCVF